MAVTPMPALDRTSATFRDDVDEYFATLLPTFSNELNTLAGAVEAAATAATAASSTATTQAGIATTKATAADASATAAAAAAGAPKWVAGTTYAVGNVAWSPANSGIYRRLVAGAGVTDPSADATNWAAVIATRDMTDDSESIATTAYARDVIGNARGVADISTSTALTTAHAGKMLVLGGSGTLTLPNVSAVPDGTVFVINNRGGGAWTISTVSLELLYYQATPVTSTTVQVYDTVVLTSHRAGNRWQCSKAARPIETTAVATVTSCTSVDVAGIPSGVKRITVMLSGVSTNGNAFIRIQIGTAVGVHTTGYTGTCTRFETGSLVSDIFTAGFDLIDNRPWSALSGQLVLTNMVGTKWIATGSFGNVSLPSTVIIVGEVSLNSVLDRVRLTTANGTDAFDAGIVAVMYE